MDVIIPQMAVSVGDGSAPAPAPSDRAFVTFRGQQLLLTAGPSTGEDVVIYTLAACSILTLSLYVVRNPTQRRLPLWLRPFAKEEASGAKSRQWTHNTILLSILSVTGLTISILHDCLSSRFDSSMIVPSIFETIPWLSATLITAIDRPKKTPRLLLTQYIFIFVAALGLYALQFLASDFRALEPCRLACAILSFIAFVVIGNMPIRDPAWDRDDIGSTKIPPTNEVRSPEDDLSLFQFWSMRWVYPLAKLARAREIVVEDVWQLPFEFQHTRLYMAFRELEGRLMACLVEANGLDLAISTILTVTERGLEVSNMRISSNLYKALDAADHNEAAFWALFILFLDLTRNVCKTTGSWYGRKAYERSRGETFIALFRKLLTRAVPGSDQTEKGPAEEAEDDPLENGHVEEYRGKFSMFWTRLCGRRKSKKIVSASQPPQQASNAKVVNLVRGDTYQISQLFWDFPKLIAAPLKTGLIIYYLVDIMGWPSAVGFSLMILFLTANTLLVKFGIKLERQRTAHSDKRAQAVSHFVEASRPLKLNGWTASWSDRIFRFREMEMLKRLHITYVLAAISTINVMGGAAYPLASIIFFTIFLKQGLPNDVIWPALALFGQLEMSMKEAFDFASQFWRTTIPIERVNHYMDEPDRDENPTPSGEIKDIVFNNASFAWPSTDKNVLEDLNLTFTTGLSIIRGKVGSGKSSLLLAALNEMELHSGNVLRPNEPIGYAQQLPWLQNKTIRENIIFHQPFDSQRYRDVLHACALGPDLAILSGGDQLKLEEGGAGLSGGQKARTALARAVYSRSRILLLDDPLAALDHDTASTIVRRLLQGPLTKDRIVVMATHRDDLVLRIADQVIDINDGQAKVLNKEEIEEELAHPYHAASDKSHDDVNHHEGEHGDDVMELKEQPEEAAAVGGVSLGIYTKYMSAGGWSLWALLAVFYGLSRGCDVARARLLEAWGNDTASLRSTGSGGGHWGLPPAATNPGAWIIVLSCLSIGQIVTHGIAQILLANISYRAAQELFRIAVGRVSKATFRYHDITPTGQLKNRLISDMGMVDGGILTPLEQFVYHFIALVLSLSAITIHQPTLLIILIAVSVLFVYFFRLYVPISRCLRRMEMRYLTPIISNIGVMQDGLVTIRALQVEQHFQDRHLDAVDDFQKQDHFFWSMAFWLDFRLSTTSAFTRVILIWFMIWYGTPASAVGFVLTQTTIAMQSVQQLCEKFAQLQLDAVSLERVEMLKNIPEEPNGDEQPPKDWPRPQDDVKFSDMSFKYAEGLDPVLQNVSFKIPGGSTCAVLGRTGSGKSTVANALLATETPFTGTVTIGDVDLSLVDRKSLRNRVTFIQQDPTLFPGTLRDNIDPENKFADSECLLAIHRVLGPEWTLDSQIDAAGKNLSQGQRQLVGITRAVLRRSGLVILDEATASIDRGTAAVVQRVLREELTQSTVITIAHRLEAVEDADWCLRLDHGKVVECGPAKDLNGDGSR